MTDTDVKSTPLAAKHVELGARMVPFAGWNMPVQYTGILDEHKAVRETCGIFDISHMGQFTVAGGSAAAWLNSMLTNDINKLNVGQGQYSVMLNDRAGVIDDLILYRMEPETFFVVVNASKIDEDFAWLSAHQPAILKAFIFMMFPEETFQVFKTGQEKVRLFFPEAVDVRLRGPSCGENADRDRAACVHVCGGVSNIDGF